MLKLVLHTYSVHIDSLDKLQATPEVNASPWAAFTFGSGFGHLDAKIATALTWLDGRQSGPPRSLHALCSLEDVGPAMAHVAQTQPHVCLNFEADTWGWQVPVYEWSNATAYDVGTMVTRDRVTYIAITHIPRGTFPSQLRLGQWVRCHQADLVKTCYYRRSGNPASPTLFEYTQLESSPLRHSGFPLLVTRNNELGVVDCLPRTSVSGSNTKWFKPYPPPVSGELRNMQNRETCDRANYALLRYLSVGRWPYVHHVAALKGLAISLNGLRQLSDGSDSGVRQAPISLDTNRVGESTESARPERSPAGSGPSSSPGQADGPVTPPEAPTTSAEQELRDHADRAMRNAMIQEVRRIPTTLGPGATELADQVLRQTETNSEELVRGLTDMTGSGSTVSSVFLPEELEAAALRPPTRLHPGHPDAAVDAMAEINAEMDAMARRTGTVTGRINGSGPGNMREVRRQTGQTAQEITRDLSRVDQRAVESMVYSAAGTWQSLNDLADQIAIWAADDQTFHAIPTWAFPSSETRVWSRTTPGTTPGSSTWTVEYQGDVWRRLQTSPAPITPPSHPEWVRLGRAVFVHKWRRQVSYPQGTVVAKLDAGGVRVSLWRARQQTPRELTAPQTASSYWARVKLEPSDTYWVSYGTGSQQRWSVVKVLYRLDQAGLRRLQDDLFDNYGDSAVLVNWRRLSSGPQFIEVEDQAAEQLTAVTAEAPVQTFEET